MHADPEYQARRLAGLQRYFDQPGARAERHRVLSAGRANPSPEELERRREHGRWLYRTHASQPEVRERALSPDARQKAVAQYVETRMGWCPMDLRPAYQALVWQKRIPAAEARKIIEAEIEGTVEHARREIATRALTARLRDERRKAEAY